MPRKLQPERRRDILDAARELFATKGYQDTNIADVAARLRMGHGTFYRYFDNKRDIFAQVIEEIIGRIAGIAIAEAPGTPGSLAEFRDQVERIGKRLYRIFADDPAAVRLVFEEVHAVDRDMRKRIEDSFDFFARFTSAYLKHGVDRGYLRADLDVETAARALNAVVYEGIRRCARADDFEAEAARWTKIVVDLEFDGLAARKR